MKQSNGMKREELLARARNTLMEVLSFILTVCFAYALQINQTHLPELLVHRTYGAPPSPSHGMAPLMMVAVPCSPTPWRSGTRWITNGQTSPPAAAPLSTCRTCRLTGSTNSACELLTCMASASPAKSLSW